jgi:hypothetical protein
MNLSLDTSKNLISGVYHLFKRQGIQPVDSPSSMGFRRLGLKDVNGTYAQELIQSLRGATTAALRLCRLKFCETAIIDFTGDPATEWFLWQAIDPLLEGQKLCRICQDIFYHLRSDLSTYQAGASWPGSDLEEDCLSLLPILENCQHCSDHFTLETILDKTILVREYLLNVSPGLGERLSGLLWYNSEAMQKSFESFHRFLLFIAQRAEKPIVLFFYELEPTYTGDYFKILSLTDDGVPLAELEQRLTQQLSTFSPQVLVDWQALRKKCKFESRPNTDERLDLPPSLFTHQRERLASYPGHPLFDEGPLRSVLIYALMAWLAEVTRQQGELTHFIWPSDAETAPDIPFGFSMTDVQLKGTSIFNVAHDWRTIIGRVVRDIGRSAGNKHLREYWVSALQHCPADDLDAPRFFSTLQEIHDNFIQREEEPLRINEGAPDLIDVVVTLDTRQEEIKFQLNSIALGYVYKPVGQVSLGKGDADLPLGELNELARTHLSRILEPDKHDPQVLVPALHLLRSRGVALWRSLIPADLKRAYARLRSQKDLTVFIVSDDPSFPWELVRPVEVKGEISNDGFDDMWWALQFNVARWLSGSRPPARDIALDRVCCVSTYDQLAAAVEERDYFKKIGVALDLPQTAAELIHLLETKDYDVIHFACHGQFNDTQPGESVVQMPNGDLLRPDDLLEGGIMTKIDGNHPLVFLNACHSGRTGATLTGIAGWAKQFIELGCGAFIGCGWEVTDPLAADFAIDFYKAFKGGMSLGKAVHYARRENREKNADNSTWLAYYLYGDPNCRRRG